MSMIEMDSTLFNSYMKNLKNNIYKILCLYEEENKHLPEYTNSLLFELSGMLNVVNELSNNHDFISILAILESLYDEFYFNPFDNHSFVKSEVFKGLSLIDKIILSLEGDLK